MAKVIRAFRERFHYFKRYNVGDDYPEDDEKRVRYLVEQGFLSIERETDDLLARGGIINSPTIAMIGESGVEVVTGIDVTKQENARQEPEDRKSEGQESEKPKRRKKGVNDDADSDA